MTNPTPRDRGADSIRKTLEETQHELEQENPESEPIPFRGQIWRTPFRCLHCGIIIPAYQFAYGRGCGPCDVGRPVRANRLGQRTELCANGHIIDQAGNPIAPLSPDGDDEWQRRSHGQFGGGRNPCYCSDRPVSKLLVEIAALTGEPTRETP